MEKIGLYQYHFRPGQFDFKNRISFTGLINSILDAAGKHADVNNFGIEELIKDGKTWMLNRILFEFIEQQPNTRNIWVETWINNIENVFTNRRFNLLDENQDIFAMASTSWAMIDIKSRRFLPLKKHLDLDIIVTGKENLTAIPEKIPELIDNIQALRTIEVLYSDIDINKHLTATRYVSMMLDCFTLEYHQKHSIKKFEINFLSEVLYGDNLEVKNDMVADNDYIVEMKKLSDSKVACRCMILWMENE